MTITLAFYKGRRRDNPKARFFDQLICWWTRGPYSHCELVDPDDGSAWSSSGRDGGVRNKVIDWSSGNWDFVQVPGDAHAARDAIKALVGTPYDWWGLLFFVIPWHVENRHKMFCSEVIAFALEIEYPWSWSPNDLMFNWVQEAFPQTVGPLLPAL